MPIGLRDPGADASAKAGRVGSLLFKLGQLARVNRIGLRPLRWGAFTRRCSGSKTSTAAGRGTRRRYSASARLLDLGDLRRLAHALSLLPEPNRRDRGLRIPG